MQQGIGKFERGEFPTQGRGRINSSYVPIEGRPLHYIGDGTGRDVYIMYLTYNLEAPKVVYTKASAEIPTSCKH